MIAVHEFSMALQIVNLVLNEAKKNQAKKIVEVNLILGKFTFLGKEQLRFSYKILTENTIMEGSTLRIKELEGKVRCKKCGYEGPLKHENDLAFHFIIPTLACPRCENITEIIQGKEFFIKNIRMKS